ncbi:hypothetical protein CHS0354_037497 [Potamilus streckersoni]|uniref:Uncharacterized protein n=1 Tax=Potamilus streckersoni TaxID=2493646 RepID=A0AAE0RPJ2_9BIVA|nr:hypothetical protein CHS0354_037497 [Potamilus streckersoni]
MQQMQNLRTWNDPPLKWQTIEKFSKRVRPMEIYIENKTMYILKLEEDFLETGERIESVFKREIDPGSGWLTFVANKSPSLCLSVGGGLKYRLKEDCILYIGFKRPFVGEHLSYACLSKVENTAKWAYLETQHGAFKSSEFGGCRATGEIVNGKYCSSKRIVFRVEST